MIGNGSDHVEKEGGKKNKERNKGFYTFLDPLH